MHKIKIKNLNLDIDNNDLILNNKHNLEEFKSCKSDSSLSRSKKKLKNNLYKTLPDLNKQTKNFKIKTESKFDFNNTRRFSKYSPRKINIYKVNNKLTYIEPYRYSFINKNINIIDIILQIINFFVCLDLLVHLPYLYKLIINFNIY